MLSKFQSQHYKHVNMAKITNILKIGDFFGLKSQVQTDQRNFEKPMDYQYFEDF